MHDSRDECLRLCQICCKPTGQSHAAAGSRARPSTRLPMEGFSSEIREVAKNFLPKDFTKSEDNQKGAKNCAQKSCDLIQMSLRANGTSMYFSYPSSALVPWYWTCNCVELVNAACVGQHGTWWHMLAAFSCSPGETAEPEPPEPPLALPLTLPLQGEELEGAEKVFS